MRKLIVLLMVFTFSFSLVLGQTEEKIQVLTKSEEQIKEKIKETKEELKIEKEELKTAQKERKRLEGSDVSNSTKGSFSEDFGVNTNVEWNRTEFYDVATFTDDSNLKKAYYDFSSQLIGTTWYVNFTDLPARGQKEINEKYGDYAIGEVVFYDDNESVDVDFFIFESHFKHEDNYFVELTKDSKHIILRVDSEGDVHFFKNIK